MTQPAAFLILAADRPLAEGATYIAVPIPAVSLKSAREIKAHTIYGLGDITRANFRFAALRRPADMIEWAETRGVRILVESHSVDGIEGVRRSDAWRI